MRPYYRNGFAGQGLGTKRVNPKDPIMGQFPGQLLGCPVPPPMPGPIANGQKQVALYRGAALDYKPQGGRSLANPFHQGWGAGEPKSKDILAKIEKQRMKRRNQKLRSRKDKAAIGRLIREAELSKSTRAPRLARVWAGKPDGAADRAGD